MAAKPAILLASRYDQPEKSSGSRRTGPAKRFRPRLELLEDRTTPSFSPVVSYSAGAYPHAVQTADFNGDGQLDLAVANVFSSSVSVLLGNADGTFQPALTSATGYLPLSLAVGDFNNDGKVDLVTVGDSELSVLLGDGNGAFQASPIGPGLNPASVAVGDFNADGNLDLVVTSSIYTPGDPGTPGYYAPDPYGSGYEVYYPGTPGTPGHFEGWADVLLGYGDGAFQLAQTLTTGSCWTSPSSAREAVADFNNDGMPDIVTANDNGTVSVLLGDGDGNFQDALEYAAGAGASSVAVGDFNGDGKADLVTANVGSSTVSVLLANGAGSFGAAQNYAVGVDPWSVAVADFNGDGKTDLVTTNANSVSVLLGNGDGAFQPARDYAAGDRPMSVALADFNGDGLPDLAVTNYYSSEVSVLINDGIWPAPGASSISINDVTVAEGDTGTVNATFTLSLSAAYGQPVTVHYETANGSATAGSDYMAMSGDVTFAPGETNKTIAVLVYGDTLYEPTESFFIRISATNAIIADGSGTGTIQNDDPTPPALVISDVSVTEGNTGTVNATFTLTLSHASNVDVTVHYDTADISAAAGSDYTAASGDVTIAAGQTSQTFTVAVIGDRLVEPTETFAVNLSAATNATITDGQGIGTILDNEPRISINDVTKKEGNGKTTVFTFAVTLSAAYDEAVTVYYATADGSATAGTDYESKTGSVTFAPGETTKTITVVVKGDKDKEADETFFVDLFGASSNALIDVGRGIGTILDDDNRP